MRPGTLVWRNRKRQLLKQLEDAKTPSETLQAIVKLRAFRGQLEIWLRAR
jgi:hypothetical protein